MKKNNVYKDLSCLYFAIYWVFACYTPFLLLYLLDRQLSYVQIGSIFALNSLVNVMFQPVWGYLTDKYIDIKKALYIAVIASSIAIVLLVQSYRYQFIILSTIVFIAFQSSILSLTDSLCYKIINRYNNIKYGRVRLMGSAGYAISSFVLGLVIARTSINIAFYLYPFFSLFAVLFLYRLNFKDEAPREEKSKVDPLQVLRNMTLLVFLLSVTIASISYGANMSYVGVLLQETGGNIQNLGLLWFVVAMSEIPVFFISSKIINRIGSINTYLLSLLVFSLRFFLCTLWNNTSFIITIQFLQGFTFPLFMAGGLDYMSGIIPAEARSFSISLMSALIFGAGALIGNMGGGIIIENFGIFTLYRIMSVISFTALLIAMTLKKIRGSKAPSL